MPEIYYGTNGPISFKTYYNGVAIDPTSTPVVTIYKGTETSGTVLTVNNTDVDEGSFFCFVPVNSTTNYEYFKVKIEYTINGTSFVDWKTYNVSRPYANVAEIVEASGFGTDRSDRNYKSYEEVMAAERWARFKINAYTGQKFEYKSKQVEVIGDGTDVLLLPERIESISKIWQNDVLIYDAASVDGNQYEFEITPTNYALRFVKDPGLDIFASYPYDTTIPEPAFFKGGNTYKVLGMFGWLNVPSEVYDSAIRLSNDFFYQDSVWKEKYVKRMQTGDWNVEISTQAFTGTGNSMVDRILEPLIVNRMVII
jgi:hypothetical protein